MAGYKIPDFAERTAAARAAKQRALDQLSNKPAPDPDAVAARQAARAAREAAAAERRAARQALAAEAKAAKAKPAEAPPPSAEEAAAAPPEVRPAPTEAELKAIRDARYAARKARKR